MDEKRCQTLQKESHQYHPYIPRLIVVRPVPQLEVAPSDDELGISPPTNQRAQTRNSSRLSPELGDEDVGDLQFQDEEEPSDLEEARADAEKSEKPPTKKFPKLKPPGRQREDIRLASRSVAISSVIRSDLRDNVDEVVSVVDDSEDVEDIITVMMGMVGLGAGGEL
jgi:hypothetical protein